MNTTSTSSKSSAGLDYRSLSDLKGYKVLATDGEVGEIADLYFDDSTWEIRYFVVETGWWLSSRRVLVSPSAFADSKGQQPTISTNLTRDQIQQAPVADLARPVSRQFQIELHNHFGWPLDWPLGWPGASSDPDDQEDDLELDPHLRSAAEVLGYGVRARDGEIGHVEDLIVDENTWSVRLLAIDTRNWLPGRKTVVSPSWIEEIRREDRCLAIDLTRTAVLGAPEYDPARPVNQTFEGALFDYYGRPVPESGRRDGM